MGRLASALLVTLGAAVLSCTMVPCPIGALPFDGQTAVPTDMVPVLRASRPFPPDLPWLGEAVRLQDLGGEPVAVHLDVDLDAGLVHVHPDQRLDPDTRYVLVYDPALLDGPHYVEELPDDGTTVEFSTRADVAALHASTDGSRVTVVFSEPEQAYDAVVILDEEGHVLAVTGVEPIGDDLHLLAFEGDLAEAAQVHVAAGLRAVSGAVTDEEDLLDVRSGEDLGRWRGQPYCEF